MKLSEICHQEILRIREQILDCYRKNNTQDLLDVRKKLIDEESEGYIFEEIPVEDFIDFHLYSLSRELDFIGLGKEPFSVYPLNPTKRGNIGDFYSGTVNYDPLIKYKKTSEELKKRIILSKE